jgi:hypothetical protein
VPADTRAMKPTAALCLILAVLYGIAFAAVGLLAGAAPAAGPLPDVPGYASLNEGGFASRWGTGYVPMVSTAPIDPAKPIPTPQVPRGWKIYAGPVPTLLDNPPHGFILVREDKGATSPATDPPPATKPAPIAPPAGAIVVRAGDKLPVPKSGQTIALDSAGTWHGGKWSIGADRVRVTRFGDATRYPRLGSGDQVLEVTGDDCTFEGIDFAGSGRSGIGVRVSRAKGTTLFRDCTIRDFGFAGTFEDSDTVRLQGCRVFDNYGAPGKRARGLYFGNVRRVELLDCLIDRNGGDVRSGARRTNIFDHNVYVRGDCGPALVSGCVVSRGCSHGVQVRSGGDVVGCLFIDNPIHLSFGHVNGEGPVHRGGVSGQVRGNVFLGTGPIDGHDKGRGIDVANVLRGVIADNVFAAGGPDAAIRLEWCDPDGTGSGIDKQSVGIRDLSVTGNVIAKGWPDFWRHKDAGVQRLELQAYFDKGTARDVRGLVDLPALRAGRVSAAIASAAARVEAVRQP